MRLHLVARSGCNERDITTDIHLGFGQETACGVAYCIGALGCPERADGSRIKITGLVKAATCAGCQDFFTGKGE